MLHGKPTAPCTCPQVFGNRLGAEVSDVAVLHQASADLSASSSRVCDPVADSSALPSRPVLLDAASAGSAPPSRAALLPDAVGAGVPAKCEPIGNSPSQLAGNGQVVSLLLLQSQCLSHMHCPCLSRHLAQLYSSCCLIPCVACIFCSVTLPGTGVCLCCCLHCS